MSGYCQPVSDCQTLEQGQPLVLMSWSAQLIFECCHHPQKTSHAFGQSSFISFSQRKVVASFSVTVDCLLWTSQGDEISVR